MNAPGNRLLVFRLLLPVTAIFVFVVDFYTKMLAVRHLQPEGWRRVQVIPGFFDFLLAKNEGAAFSILAGKPLIIAAFSIVAIGAIVWWSLKLPRNVPSAQLAFGMILGGAVGNLLDRIRFQHVIDFIHWYFVKDGKEYYWPTFNIADTAIVTGIGIFLYLSLFTKKLDPVPASSTMEPSVTGTAESSSAPVSADPA